MKDSIKSIFDYTHELSHSAFWAWCLRSKDRDAQSLRRLLLKGISKGRKISHLQTEVSFGKRRYDICIVLKGKEIILIETKLDSNPDSQIEKYPKSFKRAAADKDWIEDKFKLSRTLRPRKFILLDILGSHIKHSKSNGRGTGIPFKYIGYVDLVKVFHRLGKIDNQIISEYKSWLLSNTGSWSYYIENALEDIKESNRLLRFKDKIKKNSRFKNWGPSFEIKDVVGLRAIGIIPKSEFIQIEFWFANNQEQALEIYSKPEIFKRLEQIPTKQSGWELVTDFHLGRPRGRGIYDRFLTTEVKKYYKYFKNHQDIIGEYHKEELIGKIKKLQKLKIVKLNEGDGYDYEHLRRLYHKKTNRITIRPGFGLLYRYQYRNAIEAISTNKKSFTKLMAKQIGVVLKELG